MEITLTEYQEEALKILNEQIAKSKIEQIRYCCMGMLEETGEIVAEIRKAFFKGNFHEKKINKQEITSECGDLLWYMALMCKESNIDIEKIDVPVFKRAGQEEREELIERGIKLGQRTGRTVKHYLQYHRGEVTKADLEKSLRRQFKCMKKLLRELNITLEEVIADNLNKVTSRYESQKIKSNVKNEEER